MDADTAAEQFFGYYPTGPLVVHVVDHDHEYWLEVTEVKGGSLIEPPWKGGVILETRPIPDGVLARASITKPRPYFQPLTISPQPIDDDAKKWVESLPDTSIPAGTLHRLPDKLTRAGFAPDPVGVPITEQEVTLSRPEPTMQIDVDPHYGRTPTNEDIATKSPEQLRQMYPHGFGSAAEHDPALDSMQSETENLDPPAPELRFRQYRDPFMQTSGTEHLVRGDGAQSIDRSEPHYMSPEELAAELRLTTEAGREIVRENIDHLFANPHMGEPKE